MGVPLNPGREHFSGVSGDISSFSQSPIRAVIERQSSQHTEDLVLPFVLGHGIFELRK